MTPCMRSPGFCTRLAAPALGLALLALPLVAAGQQSLARYVDADGQPLPYQDDDTITEYLLGAQVVANRELDIGVTGPRRLTLELDSIRLDAVFRHVDETHTRVRLADGSYYQRLRDFHGYEIAAYRLSKLLAMDNVPPVVTRTVGRDDGTVQLWLPGAMMEQDRVERGLQPPDGLRWARQIQEMLLFDELVGNVDRNPGNLLIDSEWKVWLIDHTRAFQQGDELRGPGRIRMVRRDFLEAMRQLDDATIEAAIGDIVEGRAREDMLQRRDLLLAHLDQLIAQRGEGAVIW